jgi:hypothetical protein
MCSQATKARGEPGGKNAEIEALRKELEDMKKQLAEQQAERARSQPKTPAPSPSLSSLLFGALFEFAGKQHGFRDFAH